ncbi:MAG TPA: PKD domain-containing protein [bacterium]|nr:PKD domain-containing protein [bacterium]
MATVRPLTLLAPLGALALLAGCTGHGPESPAAAPQAHPGPGEAQAGRLPDGVALTGAYSLRVGGGAVPSAELAPLRVVAAIGDVFNEVGLTPTMNGGLCDCFDVAGIRLLDADTVRVTFDVRHPFRPEFRPDLHAFNLKAHVASEPTTTLDGLAVDPGLVANADGYSPLWTSQVPGPGADLFPYRILTRDLSSAPFDFRAPGGWNVFAVGESYQEDLDLNIGPGSTVDLRLYLTVDYGQSAVRATRQSPQYELPKFAGKAPWRVEVEELANDLQPGNTASTAQYQVRVYDWGHGTGIGTDVTGGTLSIPALGFSAPLPALTGSGLDPDPLTADVLVVNTGGAGSGTHLGLVTITDQATAGTGIADDLVTPFSADDYRTFQIFPVSVAQPPSNPPTAGIVAPCAGQLVTTGRTIQFDGSGSTDDVTPPASLTYEWDFDYDGITFTVDGTGIQASHQYVPAGSHTAALRVTDGDGQSDIDTISLTVQTPAWHNLRNLTNTPTSGDSLENQFGEFGRRMFIDSTGEAHLIFRPGSGNIQMANLGLACTGGVVTLTDLGLTRIPNAVQGGDTLHLSSLNAAGTAVEYRTLDLLTRTVSPPEVAITAATLPAPGGSSFNASRIARDKNTGNLFVIGETGFGSYDLYSVERTPTGTWSAPLLADNRNATSFASYLGAGATNNECFLIYHDYVVGNSGVRRAYYCRKPFGAASWTSRLYTGFPDGAHLCFWLWEGPGNDMLGGNFMNPSGSGAQAFYLRWDHTGQAWSRAQIGNLYNYNFFPNVLWDPRTDQVTVVWEHLDQSGLNRRRIVSKQFAHNAPASVISDGTYTLVYENPTFDNNEPAAAINPVTGDVVAAWEQDMDPGASYFADLFAMNF